MTTLTDDHATLMLRREVAQLREQRDAIAGARARQEGALQELRGAEAEARGRWDDFGQRFWQRGATTLEGRELGERNQLAAALEAATVRVTAQQRHMGNARLTLGTIESQLADAERRLADAEGGVQHGKTRR